MANEYLVRNEEIVDGLYPLGPLIARSIGGAIYETEFGEGEGVVRAVIRICEVESTEAAESLRLSLRSVNQLAHPNLIKIYATGSCMLNGTPVLYVVMEKADESLAGVLADRALTTSETREMLALVVGALELLHKEGYAHSRLTSSNVLAVNDQLKLSIDGVVPANDGETAEDMRALGALIVQALTQRIPNANECWEFQDFPQPLAEIVRHCLDPDSARRWTAEQVKESLSAPALVVAEVSRSEESSVAGRPRAGTPKWVFAGLAALILVVILAAIVRRKGPAPVPIPVTSAAQQSGRASVADPLAAESKESQATASPRVTSLPHAGMPQPPQPGSGPNERKASGWAVILGAYGSREPAEKRMRAMAKRWPRFEISVFESQAEKTHYLVVLGRNLSEDQAQALRRRAIESGLPGDTYIKHLT